LDCLCASRIDWWTTAAPSKRELPALHFVSVEAYAMIPLLLGFREREGDGAVLVAISNKEESTCGKKKASLHSL
jgi:hypothetical protein